MRIVCPICSAAYEVRDSLLAPARAVRCARCGEEWVPIPTAPAAPPEPEPEPEPDLEEALPPRRPLPPPRESFGPSAITAMDRLASRPAPLPRTPAGLRAAWAASLIFLVLLGCGLVVWRDAMMHAWPPSTRLYDWIGLGPVPGPPAR